jgi:Fur family ferric uptake transcriptional regulator
MIRRHGRSRGEASLDGLFRRLDAYMAKKGLRSTTQRRLIAESFFRGPSHVTIEDLLSRVRKLDARVGYATVYRTLKLFTECGIAAERNFGDGPTRYELSDESTHHHHDHCICLECGRIVEFHDDRIEVAQERAAARLGFRIVSHKHEIYGVCAECQRAAPASGVEVARVPEDAERRAGSDAPARQPRLRHLQQAVTARRAERRS